MKKRKYLLITFLLMILIIPIGTFASGSVSVSTTKLSITQGKSATFTVKTNNAAGKINISTSDSTVASISKTTMFLDMQSDSVTISGKSVGTATITVYAADVTTYDDEDLSGKTYKITVTVKEATTSNGGDSSNSNKSSNNSLKTISVEGYELTKKDSSNYTLIVPNNITSININASAEDSKAKVTGTGTYELTVGDNNIVITVTAESGSIKKYTIKATRKDGYYLEELSTALSDKTVDDRNIIIESDSVLSSSEVEMIKNSTEKVSLNYYSEDGKLLYSWILDGNKIKKNTEFFTAMSYASDNIEKIYKASNYSDGIYLNFKHEGSLPEGTKIKIYVGDKFSNGNLVNVYYYDETGDKLSSVQKGLTVEGEYVEIPLDHCSYYFVTMASIGDSASLNASAINPFMIVAIVEMILLISLMIYIFKKRAEIIKG